MALYFPAVNTRSEIDFIITDKKWIIQDIIKSPVA